MRRAFVESTIERCGSHRKESHLKRSLTGLRVILLVLAGAHTAHAQVTGGVRVTVRDAEKLAVPGADVVVKAEASAVSQNNQTNSEGQVTFPAVPLGHYVVTVTLSGFAPVTKTIAVVSNIV